MCKYHTNEELCNNIVIGDPTRNLPKPINYRPGYDMDYVRAYYQSKFSRLGLIMVEIID